MWRHEPPLKDFYLYCDGEWWGSPYCLVRSARSPAPNDEFPDFAIHRCDLTEPVKHATEALPGEPLELGPPRWDLLKGDVAEMPIVGVATAAIDADFFVYAEAETSPDEWRWVQADGRTGTAVGLRAGALVAIIAGRRVPQETETQPEERAHA